MAGSRFGRVTTMKLLLEAGANPEHKSNALGLTALSVACLIPRSDIAKLLLEGNANPDCKEQFDWTPLFSAVEHGNVEIVRLLLDHGANVNAKNEVGLTPLSSATEKDSQTLVTMLMENGACHVDGHFKHPEQLFVAAYCGQSKYTKFLLQIGVDANMTEQSYSALSIAAWSGEFEVVTHLLDHNAEIDYQVPHSGSTALFAAASGSYSEVVRHLLERGANPNIKDKYGQTPLFIAIMQENDKVTNILLDAGSNPNARGIYGRNPLM